MTCPACEEARRNPLTGRLQDGCQECAARELANSPAYFESDQAGHTLPAYRAALARVFPDSPARGHARVKAWAKHIAQQHVKTIGAGHAQP